MGEVVTALAMLDNSLMRNLGKGKGEANRLVDKEGRMVTRSRARSVEDQK